MRLRFSIRDLLWLAAVVALAVGWWSNHRATVADFHRTVEEIQKITKEQTKGIEAERDSLRRELLDAQTAFELQAARQRSRAPIDNMPIVPSRRN